MKDTRHKRFQVRIYVDNRRISMTGHTSMHGVSMALSRFYDLLPEIPQRIVVTIVDKEHE